MRYFVSSKLYTPTLVVRRWLEKSCVIVNKVLFLFRLSREFSNKVSEELKET